ncbi:16322_t:CDS:2 [Dentiscutata erythropus]|uniref:16322_t:CDS:1 n=1 Tax=Dentiscutata erythropus TaxID=1348616 RepID=A0A9N8YRJ0_9GLOM|nr:16322_t:CDS:2 [Dentiscutata erythropus]
MLLLRNLRPRTTEERKAADAAWIQKSRKTYKPKKKNNNYNVACYFRETTSFKRHIFTDTYKCTCYHAILFPTETHQPCCGSGKIKLMTADNDSAILKDLFMRRDKIGKNFCQKIRAYNSAFAFTFMGVKLDKNLANVAAIWIEGNNPEGHTKRDIIIDSRSQGLQRVSELSGSYDPMQKPSPSLLFYGGRLFQQYIVDNYDLQDSYQLGTPNMSEIGRHIILPSTFIDGPRDMYQRYQDAMALVQTYGKPDLFITITCNPWWNEIKSNLLPRQTPQDRPDLTDISKF